MRSDSVSLTAFVRVVRSPGKLPMWGSFLFENMIVKIKILVS